MCGIVGIIRKLEQEALRPLIQDATQSLKHRGPDYDSTYVQDGLALGHTRLSIIDLSEDAHQPMIIDKYVIVFNGELYNYLEIKQNLIAEGVSFTTQSDTEVLLRAYIAWGYGCLERFNGMFAFAIWDGYEEILFCARDRLGIKPFYFNTQNGFAFASEIKAFSSMGVALNPNYRVIQSYLMDRSYGANGKTFFANITQLQPGHFLTVSEFGGVIEQEYWSLKHANCDKIFSEDTAIEEYCETMLDSIRLRLRGDVPIGVNVSGGLDSSLLLGLVHAREPERNFHVYTYTCNDPEYDETPYVKELLKEYNHTWHRCMFNQSDFYEALVEMQQYQDEPFGGLPCLAYANIFKEAGNQGVKILLSGEGMDEQWGGYDYYQEALNKHLDDIPDIPVIQHTGNIAPFLKAIDASFIKTYEKPEYPSLFSGIVDSIRYRDFVFTKMPRSLRFGDRFSMMSGKELRVPFLDHRLVELSFRMPNRFLFRDGVQKYLLRKIAKGVLKCPIVELDKRPLQTPQREWLREGTGWINDLLYSGSFEGRGLFNMSMVRDLHQRYRQGEFNDSFFLWQWINLEMWFRTHID